MIKFRHLVERLDKIPGTQYGSNEGGVHVDSDTGKKFYVKHYHNGDQAKTEELAGKVYEHLGVPTLKPKYQVVNGRHSVVTEWNPHMTKIKPHDFERTSKDDHVQLARHYHASVLTKNWDAIGLEHDNVMRHAKTGALHNVDLGGAFHFRAQGGPKHYGSDIAEHESMRNNQEASGHVFGHVFSHSPTAEKKGLDGVRNMDERKVHKTFKESGLHNWQDLHSSFMARRQKLLNHYGVK